MDHQGTPKAVTSVLTWYDSSKYQTGWEKMTLLTWQSPQWIFREAKGSPGQSLGWQRG